MDNLTEIYNSLYQSTYCVNAPTKKLYFIFFEQLIEKYLTDNTKNYTIYVSTTDKLLPQYQIMWPNHARLQYISDSFVPTAIPTNTNAIYFFHQNIKPTKEQQMELINFVESHPLLKYVYIGNVDGLLPYTQIKLFKYYLHFEMVARRWGGIKSCGIINYKISRTVCRKYYSQNEKKKKVVKPISIYDYFIFHDLHLDSSKMVRFNKQIFKPKNRPLVSKPNTNTPQAQNVQKEVQIKYIYTGAHSNPNSFVMPDGSRENYKQIVEKYKDVIEI